MRKFTNLLLVSAMSFSLVFGHTPADTINSASIYAEEVSIESYSEETTIGELSTSGESTSEESATSNEDTTVAGELSSEELTSGEISSEEITSPGETTTPEDTTPGETTTPEDTTPGETTTPEETTTQNTTPPVKVLFIGNSSTYYNNMPEMVAGLATADNINTTIKSITASNYKLSLFITDNNPYYIQIMNALSSSTWDYVVIQDHREVIIPTPGKTEEALEKLRPAITAAGAELILYETQADYVGHNFKLNDMNLYFTHADVQHLMTKNYFSIGNKMGLTVAPVGVNYTRCMNTYPDIELYNKDNIHPSVEGSYLTACTLYRYIFGTSAYDNEFLPGSKHDTSNLLKKLDEEDAKKLQEIADAQLTLDKKQIVLQKGTTNSVTGTLTYTVENTLMDTFQNRVEYFSLNDSVVMVNRYTGTVTAVGVGNTMIMATTDSGLVSLCSVSVKQPATSISIAEASTIKMLKNDTVSFTLTVLPADTTDMVIWTSSDPSVATVDQNGVVTAIKAGIAKVTATTDSGLKVSRSIRVKLATPTIKKVKKLKTKAKNKKFANVRITWKKNPNAVKYYVYRSTKKNSGYKKIATVTKARYTDKNKRKGKTFYYKVKAVFSKTRCNSNKSAAVKFTVPK